MIRQVTIFLLYIKVCLFAENIDEKIKGKLRLDKGGVNIPDPSIGPVQETNSNLDPEDRYKLYLYQRVKLDFNQDSMTDLYFGLNKDTFTAFDTSSFKVDLGSDKVLVNMNNNGCNIEMNCHKKKEDQHDIDYYNGFEYKYFDADAFLGVNRIRPGEINMNTNEEIKNFYALPVRFYDNNENMHDNVLGLSPKSPIWTYWRNIYHFPGRFINMTVCYYDKFEYLLFDSNIDMDQEVMFKVADDSDVYKFTGQINYNTKDGQKINKDVNVCISNEPGLTMRLDDELYDDLKRTLCNEASYAAGKCNEIDDLDFQQNLNLNLRFADFFKNHFYFTSKFNLSSLYYITGTKINWKFDKLNEFGQQNDCQITLEKDFLMDKYFMISKNVHGDGSIYAGFKLMNEADFSPIDFYTVTMALLMVGSGILFIVFLILNNQLNALIKKEEERQKEID